MAVRRSVSLRITGEHNLSDRVLHDAIKDSTSDVTDVRVHYAYGRLLLSLAENTILRKQFNEAKLYLTS